MVGSRFRLKASVPRTGMMTTVSAVVSDILSGWAAQNTGIDAPNASGSSSERVSSS
jgi:hypothetical protein